MKASTTSILQFVLRVFSAVLGAVATIVFARILGAEALGTYVLALSLIVWLELVSSAGLGPALVKRISEGTEQDKYFFTGVTIQLSLTGLVLVLLFAFRTWVTEYVGADVTVFIAVILVLRVCHLAFDAGLRGENRVATASILRFGERTTRPLTQIGLAVLGATLAGLLVGYIASMLLAVVVGALLIGNRLTAPTREHAASLLAFAKYSWMGFLRSRAARWMDTIVLGFFVSNTLIAVYEAGWTLTLFLFLASDSLSNTLFPKVSELAENNELERIREVTETGLAFVGVIVIPGVAGSWLLGADLLRFFGPDFVQGQQVLLVLVLFALFISYERLMITILNALNRPDLAFRVNLCYVVCNLIGNVVLVTEYGLIGAAVATSGSGLVSTALALYYQRQVLDFQMPYGEILKQAIAAVAMSAAVVITDNAIAMFPYWFVLVPVFVGAFTYGVCLLTLSSMVRERTWRIVGTVGARV
ncbi:oligosaccharide flippase family protein [Haloarchaeobius baliensis]|uniref:oligosaccharide flippase family protein n=1 Tax=Haloarchaeobius baliensis TaxID=1670458 RepID=UPI003F880F79